MVDVAEVRLDVRTLSITEASAFFGGVGVDRCLAGPAPPCSTLDAPAEEVEPAAIETEPTRPNEIGMHCVAVSVDDINAALEFAATHGYHPLCGVSTSEDIYKLTYIHGPSGIIMMLEEELKKK